MEEINKISNIELINLEIEGYNYDLEDYFSKDEDLTFPLLSRAKTLLNSIEKLLYKAPAFIEIVRTSFPEKDLKAVLTNDQKLKLAKGTLRLMTKKDGKLLANLIDAKTNKIVSSIPLEMANITPAISDALLNYSICMQIAQIAEEMQYVKGLIEEVQMGQELDRLATAYSCHQKFLQAMQIKNSNLREKALLQVAFDSEDSRNLLMQIHKFNLQSLMDLPEGTWGKITKNTKTKETDAKINSIKESLIAINDVSIIEALSYIELGEFNVATESLKYYDDFLNIEYFSQKERLKRLDLLDYKTTNDFENKLKDISKKISILSNIDKGFSLKGGGE